MLVILSFVTASLKLGWQVDQWFYSLFKVVKVNLVVYALRGQKRDSMPKILCALSVLSFGH